MAKTNIEWSDRVINFIEARADGTTCDAFSDGCTNCYAQKFAKRLKGMKNPLYDTNNKHIKVNLEKLRFELMKLPKKPQRVFLESMSDLFHIEISEDDVLKVLRELTRYPQHTFLVLTKRYQRLASFLYKYGYTLWNVETLNVQFGVSICNSVDLDLAWEVFRTYSTHDQLFISFEPLLGYISIAELRLFFTEFNINWVIVGAETGQGRREFKEEWGNAIWAACRTSNIPFFFKKQYKNGEWTNKLKGKEYLQFPEVKQ